MRDSLRHRAEKCVVMNKNHIEHLSIMLTAKLVSTPLFTACGDDTTNKRKARQKAQIES